MLVKLIECEVPHRNRSRFSRGQEAWAALRESDGFLGQVGGWEASRPELAVILGFWRDAEAYDRFMREVHDKIFKGHGQEGSYDSCEVALFDRQIEIAGSARWDEAIARAALIRVAKCGLLPDREDHFVKVQRSVWNPGMASSGGMLAGAFSVRRDDPRRYLVCTLWRTEADHARYRAGPFDELRRQAEVGSDCETLTGRIVHVEPTWHVPPAKEPV